MVENQSNLTALSMSVGCCFQKAKISNRAALLVFGRHITFHFDPIVVECGGDFWASSSKPRIYFGRRDSRDEEGVDLDGGGEDAEVAEDQGEPGQEADQQEGQIPRSAIFLVAPRTSMDLFLVVLACHSSVLDGSN